MPRRPWNDIETLHIPQHHADFADHRIDAIVRRAGLHAGLATHMVERVARSCYLQGVWDVVQLIDEHPELLKTLLRGGTHVEET